MKRKLAFHKYQGAGNDFVLIDDRAGLFDTNDRALIERLCDRRFGIGADGLMLLREKSGFDFEMVYFNSDGRPSSMCGNGGRCISRFAADLGLSDKRVLHFLAVDGPHEAELKDRIVKLKMNDVRAIEKGPDYYLLDTGSPHFVRYVVNLEAFDVYSEGRTVRYSERFAQAGVNVNFVELRPGGIAIRTYERGVENETLACGTGVTAAALTAALKGAATSETHCAVAARGGDLNVYFRREGEAFSEVWLEGGAEFVFRGEIEI